MKKKEKELLRAKNSTGLKGELEKKQRDLVAERMKKAQGKGKNVKIARNLKKEIAVIKTILREKELEKKNE